MVTNPYPDDDIKAGVFEEGYLWGFNNPPGDDNPPPYSPELYDVYIQGVDTGKDDFYRSPGAQGAQWVGVQEVAEKAESDDGWHDFVEHVLVEGFAEGLAHAARKAAWGLLGVLITVVGIPGDVQLRPLEDFEDPYDGPEDDANIWYAATCTRTDHGPVPGADADGYWYGTPSNDFAPALREASSHEHYETFVARCSLTDQTCGLVWAARIPYVAPGP